jgi:hypothetical protein
MIRLEFTLTETEQLHHWLVDLGHDPTAALQRQQLRHLLLTKLRTALDNATCPTECPVCHTCFTQAKTGRYGRYCSPACKQKAYRQRRQEWLKRVRSAPRR